MDAAGPRQSPRNSLPSSWRTRYSVARGIAGYFLNQSHSFSNFGIGHGGVGTLRPRSSSQKGLVIGQVAEALERDHPEDIGPPP